MAKDANGRAYDWESIEGEYRAGVFSVREIAKRYKITEGAVRKRANKERWLRDLTTQVHAAVRSQLIRDAADEPEPAPAAESKGKRQDRPKEEEKKPKSEREIIAAAATTVAKVINVHRSDIAKGRGIVELLFDQLHDAAGNRHEIEDTIYEEEKKSGERRYRMLRAVSLPMHAATVRDLSQAMRNLVMLEREAYNIDDAPAAEPEQAQAVTAKVAGKILTELNALAAG